MVNFLESKKFPQISRITAEKTLKNSRRFRGLPQKNTPIIRINLRDLREKKKTKKFPGFRGLPQKNTPTIRVNLRYLREKKKLKSSRRFRGLPQKKLPSKFAEFVGEKKQQAELKIVEHKFINGRLHEFFFYRKGKCLMNRFFKFVKFPWLLNIILCPLLIKHVYNILIKRS